MLFVHLKGMQSWFLVGVRQSNKNTQMCELSIAQINLEIIFIEIIEVKNLKNKITPLQSN